MATEKQQGSADDRRDVLVERHNTTIVARLNRPQHGNSVQGTLMRDLLDAFETADGDDSVRAIVTIGEGSTYCVGADRDVLGRVTSEGGIDFQELGYQGDLGGDWGMPALSAVQRRSDTLGFGRWVTRILDVSTPTIAAINGGTAGGGLALALLHDIRIASRTAKFAPVFVALGVSPELGVSWLLPRIVGWPKAFDLLTRVRPIDADEALEIGLVEAVVEPHELLDAALARAAHFAQLPKVSVRMVKRLLRQSTESTLQTQLEREWHNQTNLFSSPEIGAAAKAYLDRL
ncbi:MULTISPECIES: enoyl-CoA hydratase/isomerase family protein [Mycobacterium]|uniref:Enoyl-CoA hydratase n=1 Tax=Mycobacterium kiyosense TaxID=2871094 RepID=A0A9P3Q5E0_9MYCO|nr:MULTISPECIES: enoyl-CoA hydratase/isomerase family protein [Mycobacterium]BDB44003.1 enoyl-CoA hydratase [Mycobacterium kiyosense]BDE15547.1 enoyl-CoA hydratase [Mycobacterium sp. 20KCMC460]GLB81030.1 enoyl-CoA hydratase [Mycobacterium kiyosense]GLB87210.1 enoyl-CoA hydratase [Mycobacterium kiyosense]GLB93510.1 enoyl-CoA hydratase [Mycobacterium kiyosense]